MLFVLKLKRFIGICTPVWSYSGIPKGMVEGVWRIYNETPIRQNRGFGHYGDSLETVAGGLSLPVGEAKYPDFRVCDRCVLKCREVHRGKGVYI
jgi:hypothetical protein